MPVFLAVFTMTPQSLERFRAMPKADQDAVDAAGVPAWEDWERRNADVIRNRGGMVGKTTRVSRGGAIGPATNDLCGYVIVEAESAEAAAALFVDHPHVAIFPGDTIEIMPFVTEPDL